MYRSCSYKIRYKKYHYLRGSVFLYLIFKVQLWFWHFTNAFPRYNGFFSLLVKTTFYFAKCEFWVIFVFIDPVNIGPLSWVDGGPNLLKRKLFLFWLRPWPPCMQCLIVFRDFRSKIAIVRKNCYEKLKFKQIFREKALVQPIKIWIEKFQKFHQIYSEIVSYKLIFANIFVVSMIETFNLQFYLTDMAYFVV